MPIASAMRTREAKDFASIFFIILPRWILTVISLRFSFAAICLFSSPAVANSITSRSRALNVPNRSLIPASPSRSCRALRSRSTAPATASSIS